METIFVNGRVITMNPSQPEASAFVVSGGRFGLVGEDAQVGAWVGAGFPVVDLKGKTVIPGLIETHNHLSYFALALAMVDVSSVSNSSIQDIKNRLAEAAAKAGPGDWITGWGYDDTLIEECRHLTRQDLDEVVGDHPVFISHTTGHLVYTNSHGLKMAGIDRTTPDPPGGIIQRDADGEPTGLLLEHSAIHLLSGFRPVPDEAVFRELLPRAAAAYHREGVTSVHDAAIGVMGEGSKLMRAYLDLTSENRLGLRVYLTMMENYYRPFLDQGLFRGFGGDYLKMGAVKNFQDGSIQALTAALSRDYFNRPGFRSRLIWPQEAMDAFVERHHVQGLQMAIHANGDGAIESVIQAIEKAQMKSCRADPRHMIIHCQMASDDHMARMKAAGIIPSFFVNHVYYWGDRHLKMFLGEERAARIDPLGSAIRAGLKFTLHADTPVTPVSPLFSMHNAVNRVTKGGVKLGADQCITAYQALEAYTTNAAYCSFEEEDKGSIEPGKLADFVVLSDDLLTMSSENLKQARVLKTYVGGRQVFEA
ncbi:MAG: amidohydrolase family protein [Pseudomonadota bacterium]